MVGYQGVQTFIVLMCQVIGSIMFRAEWIYECVSQRKIVSLDLYRPKEVKAQDRATGLCTVSQFPTQAAPMIANESISQFPIHSAIPRDQSAGTNSSFIGAAERISSTKKSASSLTKP